jgi:hypothetical protein
MSTLAYILRVIALAFLFAGTASITFAAITLVTAAHAQGVPIPQAAATNAPMFYMFGTVVFVNAILLLLGEALDYAAERRLPGVVKARDASSLICVAAAMVLKFGIIAPMQQLSPQIKDSQEAHAAFTKFHEASRIDFSIIIVCALISLLLPAFDSKKVASGKSEEAVATA